MSQVRMSFELKNRLSELKELSRRVEQFGSNLRMDKKTLFQVNFALEEIFSNIVSYGYKDLDEHQVKVSLSYENGVVVMGLEDDAEPFDPTTLPPPDITCPLEERGVGGLGLFLTRHVVDEIHYRRQGGRNILIMTKSIGPV